LEVYYSICGGACSYLSGNLFGIGLQHIGIAFMALVILLSIIKDLLFVIALCAGVGVLSTLPSEDEMNWRMEGLNEEIQKSNTKLIEVNMGRERQRLFDEYQKANECPGKRHYIRLLKGETLTLKQSMISDCFICTAGHLDGKVDCQNSLCAIYPFMPYRQDKQKARCERQIEASWKLSLLRSGSSKKNVLQES